VHGAKVLRKVGCDQQAPRDSDAVPAGMCLRCGFAHSPSINCIDYLRDRLAMVEARTGPRDPEAVNE